MTAPLKHILKQQRIIVCCGAGGAGKTSVSASMALAAARAGRRTLVVTIDPARRLAETLGVARSLEEPLPLDAARRKIVGISGSGELHVWLLDPQIVSDRVVRRLAKNPEERERLLNNPMYRNVSAMVAGMQEYTAVQAMYEFTESGRYDLIILDTPPSRNALNFLSAPRRISRFLDGRMLRFFVPDEASLLRRASLKMVHAVLDVAFGTEARQDLLAFLDLFSHILDRLGSNAKEIQKLFRDKSTSFVVVTTPAQEALDEANYFGNKSLSELELPLSGYIFNRSLLEHRTYSWPSEVHPPLKLAPRAMDELEYLAAREESQIEWQEEQYKKLASTLKNGEFLVTLPVINGGVNDLESLRQMAQLIEGSAV